MSVIPTISTVDVDRSLPISLSLGGALHFLHNDNAHKGSTGLEVCPRSPRRSPRETDYCSAMDLDGRSGRE